MAETQQPEPGWRFQLIVPDAWTTDDVRDKAKREYGLAVHIRVKIGPTVIGEDGTSLNFPVEAVDDRVLDGQFSFPVPAVGHCLYAGYFLPRTEG